MKSETLKTRAGAVFRREAGEGAPLVALHGAFVSGLTFMSLLERPPKGYRVIAPDLPGHGRSPVPSRPLNSWSALSDALLAFLDASAVSEVTLLGHSMGGGVAAVTAARFPERVRRLVLLNSATMPFSLPLKGRIPLIPGIGELVFHRLYGERMFLKFFREDVFFDPQKINLDRISNYYIDFNRNRAAALNAVRISADTRYVAERLPNIHCPTHIVWGRNDPLIPATTAERTAERIPGASLSFIEACGHSPLEEQPEAACRLIAAACEVE